MLECLTNIIGLTDCDECIDCSESLNQSDTGYYIAGSDEYSIPLKPAVYAAKGCFNGDDPCVFLDKMRKNAIRDFEMDLLTTIYQEKSSAHHRFSGLIGKDEASSTIDALNYAGWLIRSNEIKGGCLTITEINIGLNVNASLEVKIFREDTIDSIHTEVINVVAGEFTKNILEEPIELPLHDENVKNITYRIVYEIPPGAKPLNNKLTCCGKRPKWTEYGKFTGFTSYSERNNERMNNLAYGISLKIAAQCKELDWICEMSEVGGYNLTSVIGRTIQFKAAAMVANFILKSADINLFVLSNRETLYGIRNRNRKEYENYLLWIAENLPTDLTDCFNCKPSSNFRKKSILV